MYISILYCALQGIPKKKRQQKIVLFEEIQHCCLYTFDNKPSKTFIRKSILTEKRLVSVVRGRTFLNPNGG